MLCYVFISCSHIYSLKSIETVRLNTNFPEQNRVLCSVCICVCASGYIVVCKYELAGKVELYAAVLGFLPMSKHLAKVGTRCACTHTHAHIHNCMLYKVPTDVMATPYPQQEGRCSVPKKCHGNFFF